MPEIQPFIELILSDLEAFTKQFNRMVQEKACGKDTQDKKKAITVIRNNRIREDGMGMGTVFAHNTENPDTEMDFPATDKVCDPPLIVSMDPAASFIPTAGACFQLRPERGHVGIKDRF